VKFGKTKPIALNKAIFFRLCYVQNSRTVHIKLLQILLQIKKSLACRKRNRTDPCKWASTFTSLHQPRTGIAISFTLPNVFRLNGILDW